MKRTKCPIALAGTEEELTQLVVVFNALLSTLIVLENPSTSVVQFEKLMRISDPWIRFFLFYEGIVNAGIEHQDFVSNLLVMASKISRDENQLKRTCAFSFISTLSTQIFPDESTPDHRSLEVFSRLICIVTASKEWQNQLGRHLSQTRAKQFILHVLNQLIYQVDTKVPQLSTHTAFELLHWATSMSLKLELPVHLVDERCLTWTNSVLAVLSKAKHESVKFSVVSLAPALSFLKEFVILRGYPQLVAALEGRALYNTLRIYNLFDSHWSATIQHIRPVCDRALEQLFGVIIRLATLRPVVRAIVKGLGLIDKHKNKTTLKGSNTCVQTWDALRSCAVKRDTLWHIHKSELYQSTCCHLVKARSVHILLPNI